MTILVPISDKSVETYLTRLANALAAVAPDEKDEIVREIRAHIQDSVSGAPDPCGAVDRVIRLLGAPEELAERYTTESLLTALAIVFLPGFCCERVGAGQSWASRA